MVSPGIDRNWLLNNLFWNVQLLWSVVKLKKFKIKELLRKFRNAVVSVYAKNQKGSFYIGIIFSFIGLLFLLRFGIGSGTWVFLGIGLSNLAIWLLVKWSQN